MEGGNFNSQVTLNAHTENPTLHIQPRFSHFPIAPLLEQTIHSDKVSGLLDLNADFTAEARSPKSILETLTGQMALSLSDGTFKGINIARSLRHARAILRQEPLPPEEYASQQTDFSNFQGHFSVQNGNLHTDNFNLKSPLFRIDGTGDFNFVSKAIAYKLQVAVVESSQGQGGQNLEDLRGVIIPVNVSGTTSTPKIDPDVSVFLTNAAKQKLGNIIEQKKQQWLDKQQPAQDNQNNQDNIRNKLRGIGDLLRR
jgi:AsmA protein